MNKIFLLVFVLIPSLELFGIDVKVDQVLDAPPSKLGSFFGDSAVYASNGELLFAGELSFNLFVWKGDKWIKLIKRYRADELNRFDEFAWDESINSLYNSTVPDEFVYKALGPTSAEYYRVYVNESGELQAEWVDKEYYRTHLAIDPKFGYSRGYDSSLPYGYKIERNETTETSDVRTFSPVIVDRDGQTVYQFINGFRQGFVEDTQTITRNFDGTRAAMVITFHPEKDSPYYVASRPQLKKLVIFKINYDDSDKESITPVADKGQQQGESNSTDNNAVDSGTDRKKSISEEPEQGTRKELTHDATRTGISLMVIIPFIVAILLLAVFLVIIRKRRST